VESDRVIGIDLEDDGGTLTDRVIHPIPVRENKVKALAIKEPRVPVLVASDSRNDVPLFQYSSDIKVYVNSRRKVSAEFFQGSTVVRDKSWFVIEHPTLKE
jgi:phosphoserine phosphatase